MVIVKAGYKKTKIGIIPRDWSLVKLGDIGEVVIGLTYSPKNVVNNGLLVLRSSNIKDSYLRYDDNVYVNVNVSKKLRTQAGDLLICVRNGSRALIGKCALIDKQSIDHTFGAFMSIYRSSFAQFVYQQFQSDIIKKQIAAHLGATINQITNKSLNSFQIPLPSSKQERTVINDSLLDIDSLIENLERLIVKKLDIKTAVMQQLLTGKKRLPGFSGEWTKTTVGECLKIRHGKDQKKIQTLQGNNPILATSGEIGRTNSYLYAKPSVLIGRKGTINKPQYVETPFWTIDTLFYSEVKPNIHVKFLFYKFCMIDWLKYNEASGVPSLNAKIIENIWINIPLTMQEQTAISCILSDIDKEIKFLEKRLNKVKALKRGMMQVLLTGKIRLLPK